MHHQTVRLVSTDCNKQVKNGLGVSGCKLASQLLHRKCGCWSGEPGSSLKLNSIIPICVSS
mgnify:CR=1 FL=1